MERDSGVTAGQELIWVYGGSQQELEKAVCVCAISITQAITTEHPKPQHCSIHPSISVCPGTACALSYWRSSGGTGHCQSRET